MGFWSAIKRGYDYLFGSPNGSSSAQVFWPQDDHVRFVASKPMQHGTPAMRNFECTDVAYQASEPIGSDKSGFSDLVGDSMQDRLALMAELAGEKRIPESACDGSEIGTDVRSDSTKHKSFVGQSIWDSADSEICAGGAAKVLEMPSFAGIRHKGLRAAVKAVAGTISGGNIITDPETGKAKIVENPSEEERIASIYHIGKRVMGYAGGVCGDGRKKDSALRAVGGIHDLVKEAQENPELDGPLEKLAEDLERCENALSCPTDGIMRSERMPYTQEQLAAMDAAYTNICKYVWFGQKPERTAHAEQSLNVYGILKRNSIDAFNNPEATQYELAILNDLMGLKKKAIARGKDLSGALSCNRITKGSEVKKYAYLATFLRRQANVMNTEIIALDKLGKRTNAGQENRKKRLKNAHANLERVARDIGVEIKRYITDDDAKLGSASDGDGRYGNTKVVYRNSTPFAVDALVLSPHDRLNAGNQYPELTRKSLPTSAYVKSEPSKSVELSYKEILRARDFAKVITDGIHAGGGPTARETCLNDTLNYTLRMSLYEKLAPKIGLAASHKKVA